MAAPKSSIRANVYWWIERPDRQATGPRWLELVLILLILANVGAVILETVHSYYQRWHVIFNVLEMVSLGVFVAEYAARLWVVPESSSYPSRWKWVLTPSAIIDLLAILPTLLFFIVPVDLRILRTFRVLRLLKLTRYSPALGMLLAVFEEEAGAFMAGFFILLLLLIFASCGAWLAEHQAQPDVFGSIPAAMWWAVATLTTVGYGDVTPITSGGKIFGALITVLGIGMAALPAGIIASGLNEQLHRRRDNMMRQFRTALEDGVICDTEQAEIEAMRKQLGLSRRSAQHILEQVQGDQSDAPSVCPHCGKSLPDNLTQPGI